MRETSPGRRDFVKAAAGAATAGCLAPLAREEESMGVLKRRLTRPLAVTMWDFSWLERRWPGAGYEHWDVALDELKARGYDAVRIDAYPHLVDAGRAGRRARGVPAPRLHHGLAEWSRVSRKALATTECWALVDYKDWPLLDWGWIKELCEVGVRTSAETGRWFAIATSNFCGPQFRGMWRDVAWHRRMTDVIHGARIEM